MQGQAAKTSNDANKDVTKPAAGNGKTVGKSTAKETTDAAKKTSSVPSVDGIDLATLQAFITKHEGVVYHTYPDKYGNPTAGIGHLLPAGTPINEPVSKEQVAEWFQEDVSSAINGAQSVMGAHFSALNAARKCVIIDMVFNLGESGFAGFTNTIAMIESGNYAGAAAGMLESLWASQVGTRAVEDASIMRSGLLSGASAPANGSEPAPVPSNGNKPTSAPSHKTPAPTTGSADAVLSAIREGHTTLQNGSHGAAVAEVQRLLHITADGDFGPQTEAAVKTFQAAHHLTVDGCVGEHTLAVLDPVHQTAPTKPTTHGGGDTGGGTKTTPKPTHGAHTAPSSSTKPPKGYTEAPDFKVVLAGKAEIKEGMAGPSVKYVQQKIGTTADGEFGPDTKSAVEGYQGTHGIETSGDVGKVTANALWDNKKAVKPKPGAGGSAVDIARRFNGQESWSETLIQGIRGPGWSYEPVGGQTNNCAEFVTSCLRMAGALSFQEINVGVMMTALGQAGWKTVAPEHAVEGDVWAINDPGNIEHTVLITGNGSTSSVPTIGSDGTSQEIISEKTYGVEGVSIFHRG